MSRLYRHPRCTGVLWRFCTCCRALCRLVRKLYTAVNIFRSTMHLWVSVQHCRCIVQSTWGLLYWACLGTCTCLKYLITHPCLLTLLTYPCLIRLLVSLSSSVNLPYFILLDCLLGLSGHLHLLEVLTTCLCWLRSLFSLGSSVYLLYLAIQ